MNKNVFKAKVYEYLTIRGLGLKDLADRVGLSQATIYNRFNHPERLTFEELSLIRKALGFSAEALEDILGSVSCLPSTVTRSKTNRL